MSSSNTMALIEKLTGRENYATWRFAVQTYLEHEELWCCVTAKTNEEMDSKLDTKAKSKIILLVHPINYVHIQEAKTAKEVWNNLAKAFDDKGLTRRVGLLRDLINTTLENCQNIEDYVNKIMTTAHKLRNIGFEVNDEWLGTLLLAGLPEMYQPMIMALESSGVTITADSVKTKLLQDVRNSESSALYAKSKGNQFVKQAQDKNKTGKGPRCYVCNKYGHISKNCRNKKKEQKSNDNTDSGYVAVFSATINNDNNNWYIDSGASMHMTMNRDLLYDEIIPPISTIRAANDKKLAVKACGKINLKVVNMQGQMETIKVQNVLYVPELATNLLSVSQIINSGCQVQFDKQGCKILNKTNKQVAAAKMINNMYRLVTHSIPAYISASTENDSYLWHQRMAHLNFEDLNKLSESAGVKIENTDKVICISCLEGKQTRLPFPSEGSRAQAKLELIHSDVCGPMETPSLGGARYFVTFIDDFTRKVFVYLIKRRSEVFQKFHEFKVLVENQLDLTIKTLRTDNGTEYLSNEFQACLKKSGIVHQTSTPYTPQQNGLAERMNRTLLERARCMLLNAKLQKHYWAEAVSTAAYITNRCPTRALAFLTPEEMWSGKKPDITHMKIFGCEAMVHVPKQKSKKWDSKANKMLFIGYSEQTKGYRLLDPKTRKVTISRDVIFLESSVKRNYAMVPLSESAPNTCEDISTTDTTLQNLSESIEDTKDESNDDFYSDEGSLYEPEINIDHTELTSNITTRSKARLCKMQGNTYICTEEIAGQENVPQTYDEAISNENVNATKWKQSIEEELQAHAKNKTWQLIKKPEGVQVIGCKWVFRIKDEPSGPLYKSRLCAKGCSQKQGIDYKEIYSPTVRYDSVRVLLSEAAQHNLNIIQFDVKTAFLYGNVKEDIYMTPPEGLDANSNMVCKLNRSLYGLKQAPRCWNQNFDTTLKKFGFNNSHADRCLYVGNINNNKVYLLLYVDDGLLLSKSIDSLNTVMHELKQNYEMKQCDPKNFVGLQIEKSEGCIFIHQSKYIDRLLYKYKMQDANCNNIPVDPHTTLEKSTESVDKNIPYREAVGSLMHLAVVSRPDIMYGVSLLLLDLDKELEQSPLRGAESLNQNKDSDEDPRFSHPVEVKRRKHSGYIVKPRQPLSCMSPSTASTSSLAQLHDKLAALPRYRYDKEPISVCAHPELSIVTELSEVDDRQSLNTTLKFKPYGICYKNQNRLEAESKKSRSDLNKLENRKSQSDPESTRKTKWGRRLSPIVNEDTTSCLLVATIGSADDSVINDTVERLSKSKDFNTDNIVDLLVQEALQAKDDRYKSDSGINTGKKKSENHDNSETIDNTPEVDKIKLSKLTKKPKVVLSTDDESNTEAVNETPSFVSTRRRTKKELKNTPKIETFDEQVVEEFFSQHFNENRVAEIVISPALAKKINETSSETSDNFGENLNVNDEDLEDDIVPYDFNDIDVLDCLNSMVDKVCEEFDKCTKYLNKQDEITVDPNDSIEDDIPLKDIINKIQDIESKKAESIKKSASKKKIKLKYKIKTPKKSKARAAKRKNKLVLESASKMSTIIEDKGLESATESIENEVPTETKEPEEKIENPKQESPPIDAGDSKTPLTRRKRKLYSPKDEGIAAESPQAPEEDTVLSEILPVKKTPKSTATCYKDIEKDRQRIRMPRSRKSKVAAPPSPRTKKMNDIFDKIKESANSEKVKIAENTFDAYNFTSDSEDDFKVKKIEISKRNSTTTIASTESAVSKRGRALKKISYTDNKSSDESNKKKRKVTRKPRTKKKMNVEQVDLVDERMRQPKDVLNTSLVVENTKKTLTEPELVLETAPEMEIIEDKCTENPELKKKGKNIKVEATESKRPKRVLNKAVVEKVINFDEDRTESPLPGLLVEPVTNIKEDITDISANMVDKFRKIYQEGPENYINESNTTQNLLSDFERINNSPPNINEDLIQIEDLQCAVELEPKPKGKKVEKKKLTGVTHENTKKDKIKPKKKDKNKKKDEDSVINMLETTDVKSEKSIATIGITGHGESEEAPPSPKLIIETFEPRNLEAENLSHSMKDYFDKLTKGMNEPKNRCSSSSNDENTHKNSSKDKSNDSTSKSPVVPVMRLSYDDISRWLPSRRNSESDQSSVSAKSAVKQTNEDISVEIVASPKISEPQDGNDSEVSDVNDTIRRSLRLIFKNSQPSKINDSGQTKDDSDSDSNDDKPIQQIKKTAKVAPKAVESKKKESTSREKSVQKAITKRVSMISPIKLFDELISNADKNSETSLSDDETYMKNIIHTYSKKKAENAPKAKISQEKTLKEIVKEKKVGTISSASSLSKMSTSTRIEGSKKILKRRLEEERGDCKKRKVEVNNNEEVISSGVTVSSIDDWFKRMEPESSRTEVLSATTKHIMQEVLERLDTTLVEINRNTSKKFVNLFVDAQKHLNTLKEKRRGMYSEMASDILSEVVKIMDSKFAGLDKRLQELDDDFMIQLRERSVDLIREDCKHTKAMVRLLKEDVQAVLDHMDRQGAV